MDRQLPYPLATTMQPLICSVEKRDTSEKHDKIPEGVNKERGKPYAEFIQIARLFFTPSITPRASVAVNFADHLGVGEGGKPSQCCERE